MTPARPLRIQVETSATPAAGLLRAAIERRLAGDTFPSGPEDQVAQAVARAVRDARRPEGRPWR